MPSTLRLLAVLAFSCVVPATLRAEPACGDGVLDAGEACDQGSANGAFTACCTAGCELRAAGDTCRPSTGACDPVETCDGASPDCPADVAGADTDGDGACDDLDVCPAVADPGQEDDDGDGRGNACDPCTSVVPVVVASPVLRLTKLFTPGGDDRLTLRATLHGVPLSPPLDPLAHGLRLVLSDASGTPVIDARIPGGPYTAATRAGWRASSTGWSYKNGGQILPLLQGLTKLSVKRRPNQPGSYAISVIGARGNYGAAASGLPPSVTVVLDPPVAVSGQCAEIVFNPAGCFLASNGGLACR